MQKLTKRVHEQPRCSISKLGEYVAQQSSPARRREIVKSQKFPPTFQVVRYTPVSRALVEYMSSGLDNELMLGMVQQFVDRYDDANSEFERKQASCSLDAIRAFQQLSNDLDLDQCRVQAGPQTWSIVLGGVLVSIRPELLLELKARGTAMKKGFVKLYFSKTFPLDEKAAGVISAVTIAKARECIEEVEISRQHTIVVDVFGKRIFTAPKNTKRYLNEAEAACEEIAFHWNRFQAS